MEPKVNNWCKDKSCGTLYWIVSVDDILVSMADGIAKPVSKRITRQKWAEDFELDKP